MTGEVVDRVLELHSEAAQERLGAGIAAACEAPLLIFLEGELGAGKTTLARGFLRALGHRGAVKSPTYTLIESYDVDGTAVFHLDLYRVADPEELEYLGLRELLAETALVLVEWPERGAGWLPAPDLRVCIRHCPDGRRIELSAPGTRGRQIIERLPHDLQ